MRQAEYVSPYGVIKLFAERGRLCRVELGSRAGGKMLQRVEAKAGACQPFVNLLGRYFRGKDITCDGSLLSLSGLTGFQRLVLERLTQVRFGRVVTYGELARLCGRACSARAVGGAVGANPLPIFVPCHRVVASGGYLGGFGAGLRWKRVLLEHEGWLVERGRILREARIRHSCPREGAPG